MKKEWADRNAELSEHLSIKGNYDDWVITTAFYAAIHYIDHKLFPVKDEHRNVTYTDIIHAKTILKKQESPHATRKTLVGMYMIEIIPAFNFLYDACMFSRYKSYKVKKWQVEKAKRSLEKIKNFCIKNDHS